MTGEFVARHGRDCSYVTIRWWQILTYATVLALMLLLLAYRWDVFLCLVTFFFAFWYFMAVLFRGWAVAASLAGWGERRVSAQAVRDLAADQLPVYTILVPLYKEANIAGKIIHNLDRLDYPADKLDIKLLLEEDDAATLAAVRACDLPKRYDVIVVPDCLPKTKPRACNFGLKRARGEYCVIFDAEDRPEPDQLKKTVAVFAQAAPNLACVQAKLNYFNPHHNLLTRWFTIEYSTTFDLYLPGLQTLNIPIPLGGTSNHFRTGVLREIGGWDPFNVTEDCDLGIRIYKRGYRTCMVDSTTWEEANCQLWNWIRQRSRWVKGFFQTHLTHMRHPLRTFLGLGPWGFLGFYLAVGASSFMMVINVLYWLAGGVYLGLLGHGLLQGQSLWGMLKGPHLPGAFATLQVLGHPVGAWPLIYTGPGQDPLWSGLSVVFFTISCVLVLANLMFVAIHCLACCKRRYYDLLPAALLMPFYWILISIGAWKGFIQLFTNPFYWEKTVHGLDEEEEM